MMLQYYHFCWGKKVVKSISEALVILQEISYKKEINNKKKIKEFMPQA